MWLHKNYILKLLSKNRKDWLRYYKKWVSVEDKDEVSRKIDGIKWPSFLTPETLADRITERFWSKQTGEEVPSSKELLPEANKIIEIVADHYGVAPSDILKKQRGRPNEARSAAIFLTRKLRRDTLKEIGRQFQLENKNTVR